MKPIVITVQDNKILMDINEFKKHINDAYDQGFRDASSITSSQSNRWWNELTCQPTIKLTDTVTYGAANDKTTATL